MTTYPRPTDFVDDFTRADGSSEPHSDDHGRIIGFGENILHWGAIPNDTAAGTVNVDAILAAISAATGSGSRTVTIPGALGPYYLGTTGVTGSRIDLPSNIGIYGTPGESILKVNNGVTHSEQGIFYAADESDITLGGLTLDLNRSGVAYLGSLYNQNGIMFTGSTPDCRFRRIVVQNSPAQGFDIIGDPASSSVTVTAVEGSRTLTATSGTFSAADEGKRIHVAGVGRFNSNTATRMVHASHIAAYVDATHVTLESAAAISGSGKTATIYTYGPMSGIEIRDCEVLECGSVGFGLLGTQQATIRNLYVHDNDNDGAQFLYNYELQMSGFRGSSNPGGHGGALLGDYRSIISDVTCNNNGAAGFVYSLEVEAPTLTNVTANGNTTFGLDVDVDFEAVDQALQEVHGTFSNITTNHNGLHGSVITYCDGLVVNGFTSVGNGQHGILGIGRFILDNYDIHHNEASGIYLGEVETDPPVGPVVIGAGYSQDNTLGNMFEGDSYTNTRIVVADGVSTLTDGANGIAVDASLGSRFQLTTANSRAILPPINARKGQRITIDITNSSGGGITPTWGFYPAPAVVATDLGDLQLDAGTHKWAFTYVFNNVESELWLASSVITADGSHRSASITVPALPTGAIVCKIYRTPANEVGYSDLNNWYKTQDPALPSTTVVDSNSDAEISTFGHPPGVAASAFLLPSNPTIAAGKRQTISFFYDGDRWIQDGPASGDMTP